MASAAEIAERKVSLNRYTNEHIVELCRINGVDVSDLKDKPAKVQALSVLKFIKEPTGLAAATGGGLTDPDVIRHILAEFQAAREDDSRVLLATVKTLVDTIPKPPEPEKNAFIPVKEMAKLSDTDDVILWLQTFENLATRRKIDRKDWPAALEPFLTGNAQSAYLSIPLTDRADYDKVKQTILLRYKLTPSTHRMKFRKETKKASEGFLDFSARLEQYFKLWLEPSTTLMGVIIVIFLAVTSGSSTISREKRRIVRVME